MNNAMFCEILPPQLIVELRALICLNPFERFPSLLLRHVVIVLESLQGCLSQLVS